MIPWDDIHSVVLDMDGTLLDLHFDNHFWREHLPLRYGERHGLDIHQAREELMPRFQHAEGTLNWYCLDYWSQQLGLDIVQLKREVEHLIAIHPHVVDFLRAVRASGRRAVLATNAHHDSLALKMERTQLGQHLHAVICAHDLGLPKEDPRFWERLQLIDRSHRNGPCWWTTASPCYARRGNTASPICSPCSSPIPWAPPATSPSSRPSTASGRSCRRWRPRRPNEHPNGTVVPARRPLHPLTLWAEQNMPHA